MVRNGMLRELRHHPLILGVELLLLGSIGALLFAHVQWQTKLADAPRAFVTERAEEALLERLSLRGSILVNQEFRRHGAVFTNDDGVVGVEVPTSSPAHIFQLHPEDRRAAWENTPGLDFFLDDGAAPSSRRAFGGSAQVTLAEGGNDVVYVIEGNLWLHSHDATELILVAADGSPVRVTFVVRGNIYFLDDVSTARPGGAVAFIALPAPSLRATGGDIWLGDLAYGTLSFIEGFLFAAGDIDGALFRGGLVVHGALAAGGEIRVDAPSGCRGPLLQVEHDLRYARGGDRPPGL